MVTISGSNLGQKVEDILHSVSVAGVPCSVISSLYEISSRYKQSTSAGVLAEVTERNTCSTLPFVLQDCVQNRSQWWGEFRTGVC